MKFNLEALWWGLFSAGGVCFAVFVPSAVVFLGLALPLGWIEISHAGLLSAFTSFGGFIFLGCVLVLPAFHAAHRIRHALYDLKCTRKTLITWLTYGLASLVSAYWLISWLAN